MTDLRRDEPQTPQGKIVESRARSHRARRLLVVALLALGALLNSAWIGFLVYKTYSVMANWLT